jgi:hypothetical protein
MDVKAQAEKARHALAPWSGAIGGGLGWALADQVGSNFAFAQCGNANPVVMLLIGALGLATAVTGGLTSWRLRPALVGGKRLVATVGAMMAALFGLAILLQTSAALILPRCFG